MASPFGTIGEFNPASGTISDYLDRFEFYINANDITQDDKKRDILITVIGASQFRLLKDLAAPKELKSLKFKDICALLRSHYEPKLPKYLYRAKFESRIRQQNESINDFIAALRNLAEPCQFEKNLNERLCEKFVTGINDETIQQKLLTEQTLTLDTAIQIASSILTAQNGAKELIQQQNGASAINYSANQRNNKSAYNDKTKARYQPAQSTKQSSHKNSCYRCNGPHNSQHCKFRDAKCYKCQRIGHISKACRSKQKTTSNQQSYQQRNRRPQTNMIDEVCDQSQNSQLFTITNTNVQPINTTLHINDQPIVFQLDTGAALTVITSRDFNRLIGSTVTKSSRSLQTYTGQQVNVIGEAIVNVDYCNNRFRLPLMVVEGSGPPLLGRNWLGAIKLNWSEIFSMQSTEAKLEQLLTTHASVFNDIGLLKDHTVKINVKEGAVPKFCKARQPPFAIRESIEEELQRLENNGIIRQVSFSNWATPIVPVRKKDNSVRICGDYKVTLNKSIEEDKYPIPRTEDLMAKLSGGEKFTRIDFSNAYLNLLLDDESKQLTTINTHKGLFEYQRLCFGISSAPGIFQRVMESLFGSIKNCVTYFDDLYITGRTDAEHLQTLEHVLKICSEKGLSIRKEKCEFLQEKVTFLGYILDKNGLHPLPEKIRAIKEAPKPRNVHELKSFLGLINYYSKFVRNFSTMLSPLYALLSKNVLWHWGAKEQAAFQNAKDAMSSDRILIHFDPQKPIVLICDASPVGIGAVLSHVVDGIERPIAYASRSLNPAERKYSQLDREALSVIFGVKKFHKFIYGQKITILTDHKPLLGLLGEHKAIPDHASPRMQRWAILLAGYNYSLEFRPGKSNNADAFSRLPIEDCTQVFIPHEIEALFHFIDKLPVSAHKIGEETQRDPILRQVYKYTLQGWPATTHDDLKPFRTRQQEISVEKDCLLLGTRVIIPKSMQKDVCAILHDTHIGMSRMKAQARSWVWWHQMDSDIENTIRTCYECQLHAKQPAKAPLHPWDWPTEPWERLHIDFCGPFMNKMFLIIVDAHSKWMEVKIMNKITAQDTIIELRDVFATMGLPKIVVSDNGPTFTSEVFSTFLSDNGVKHVTVSPYSPASNGLAERGVQTFKSSIIKINKGCLREKVCRFLTRYRTNINSTTGVTPSELLFNRKIRTHLDLLHPSLQNHVHKQQLSQKRQHDKTAKDRLIDVEDRVFVRNYDRRGRQNKWIPGVVVEKTGPLSYKIRTTSHGIVRRHQDQIRVTHCDFRPYFNEEDQAASSVQQKRDLSPAPYTHNEGIKAFPFKGVEEMSPPSCLGGDNRVVPRENNESESLQDSMVSDYDCDNNTKANSCGIAIQDGSSSKLPTAPFESLNLGSESYRLRKSQRKNVKPPERLEL